MQQQVQDAKDLTKTLLFVSLLSLWMYWLWSRRAFYLFAWKFPGRFGLPIFGSFDTLRDLKYILDGLTKLFKQFKTDTMCIWLGLYPTLVSSDPELIGKVISSSDLLNKPEALYYPLYEALRGGIISSPASVWQHNRKLINPSFNHKTLLSFFPIFQKGKHVILSKLDKMVNKGEHRLSDMLHRASLGISVETTMGKIMGPGDEIEEEFIGYFRFIMREIVFHIMLTCANIGFLHILYFKYQNIKQRLYKFVLQLVNEKLERMKNQGDHKTEAVDVSSIESMRKPANIFIDKAIENYQKQKFSFNDIIAESNNIITASFETTGNCILSVLLMMAIHPTVQERLYEEIVNLFPEKDFEMEFEHMDQLPYLDMVISEALRVEPPLPLIGRQVTKDLVLADDLLLPNGLQIVLSIYHLHRRKDIWGPNANEFDPENFLPANMAGKHPYAYIPFSKGIRNCIGWRYALFSVKIILTGIIRNYRLTTSTKYEDIKYTYNVLLKYVNEPTFEIYRRE